MKKAIALLAAGLMICALAACGQKASKGDGEFPVTVGNFVQQERPEKVVSLTPSATEMIYDLGYGNLVSGVSSYCDLPASVTELARMGSAYEPDIEAIAATGAKLVVTTVQLTESDLTALQQKGINILYLERADTTSGIKSNYETLGKVLGGNVSGATAAAAITAEIDSLMSKAQASLSVKQASAVLLTGYPYQMATGDTPEGKLLAEAGFKNPAAAATGWLYPVEQKNALTPDVIFCASDEILESVNSGKEYNSSPAVTNGKVEAVDLAAFQRQSLRLFRMLADMAAYAAE